MASKAMEKESEKRDTGGGIIMKKIIESKFEIGEEEKVKMGFTPGCACACACKSSTTSFQETRESIIKIYDSEERSSEVEDN